MIFNHLLTEAKQDNDKMAMLPLVYLALTNSRN